MGFGASDLLSAVKGASIGSIVDFRVQPSVNLRKRCQKIVLTARPWGRWTLPKSPKLTLGQDGSVIARTARTGFERLLAETPDIRPQDMAVQDRAN